MRYILSPTGLRVIKGEPGIIYIIFKVGMYVEEYCTVFDYASPITYKVIKLKDIMIAAIPRVDLAPIFVLSGDLKGKFGKGKKSYSFTMVNLDT